MPRAGNPGAVGRAPVGMMAGMTEVDGSDGAGGTPGVDRAGGVGGAGGVAATGVDALAAGSAVRLPAERTGWPAAISVFRDGDAFFALDDTCSHALASLAEGYVDDGCVECPLHGALFRLTDGAALSLPATRPVRAHRVEVRDGTVWLHPGQAPAQGSRPSEEGRPAC